MITITGWIHYVDGDVWLTFQDPKESEFDDLLVIACGGTYQNGNKRNYLKAITTIDPSFWDQFTEDELDALIDDKDDISFEVCLFDHDTRTLIKARQEFAQEFELDNYEDEIKNDKQIGSKQETEIFCSSISSLI